MTNHPKIFNFYENDKVLARVEAEKIKTSFFGQPGFEKAFEQNNGGPHSPERWFISLPFPRPRPRLSGPPSSCRICIWMKRIYIRAFPANPPVADFIERTRNYSFTRKIMRVSKPIGEARPSIWRATTQEMDVILAFQVN